MILASLVNGPHQAIDLVLACLFLLLQIVQFAIRLFSLLFLQLILARDYEVISKFTNQPLVLVAFLFHQTKPFRSSFSQSITLQATLFMLCLKVA